MKNGINIGKSRTLLRELKKWKKSRKGLKKIKKEKTGKNKKKRREKKNLLKKEKILGKMKLKIVKI